MKSISPVELKKLMSQNGCLLIRSSKHSTWQRPDGKKIAIPNGRKKISPGVHRKVRKFLGIE